MNQTDATTSKMRRTLRWRACRWIAARLGSACNMVSNAGHDVAHALGTAADRVMRFGGVTYDELCANEEAQP